MSALRYGSVCSGIEAATVAWHPLGWEPQFFSEIEAAPRAVLAHHYPGVQLHGDFTTIQDGQYGAIDLLVGGTPCQSFSVAGLRGGLADDRGNLALQYLRLARRLRPRWLVWENVPGVLSSSGGRDFGAILGGMVELGYGFAYRVLDAQYVRVDGFGRAVPQRRRRVFVVGYFGDWRRAAAVLFERASLRGDLAPSRSAGPGPTAVAAGGLGTGCGGAGRAPARRPATQAFGGGQNCNPTDVSTTLSAHPGGRYDLDLETFVAQVGPTLPSRSSAGGGLGTDFDCDGGLVAALTAGDRGISPDQAAANMIVPVAATLVSGGHSNNPLDENLVAACLNGISEYGGEVPTLRAIGGDAAGGSEALIAFSCKDHGADATDCGVTPTLRAMGFDRSHANAGGQMAVARGYAVRRLIPEECEALQGFKPGYTAVPWRGGILSDGPRYKALGNSMAVNVMRWIGTRIQMVEALGLPAADSLDLVAAE